MRPLSFFAICTALCAHGQGLVSHAPEARTVLIEQFTGVLNVNAPEANADAELLEAMQPGRIAIARAHASLFAIPPNGEPDFRNQWADELAEHFDLVFLPSAMVNRTMFSGAVVLSASNVASACAQVLTLPSPVNLGVSSSFDQDNQELTVNVELYYTAADTFELDHISVFVKEDHIIAGQNDNMADPPWIPDYDHRHVLRAYITDLWGDPVPEAEPGTTVQRTYTYVLPPMFNPAQCSVVAFVGDYQSTIYQAREVTAIAGTTVGVSEPSVAGLEADIRFVNGQVQVVFAEPIHEPVEITVRDVAGRLVHAQRNTPGDRTMVLAINDATPGIYLCSVRAGQHTFARRLFIPRG